MILITPLHYNRIKLEDKSTFPQVVKIVIKYSVHADMPVYELVWNTGKGVWHCLPSHCEMPILPGDLWCEIPEISDLFKKAKMR